MAFSNQDIVIYCIEGGVQSCITHSTTRPHPLRIYSLLWFKLFWQNLQHIDHPTATRLVWTEPLPYRYYRRQCLNSCIYRLPICVPMVWFSLIWRVVKALSWTPLLSTLYQLAYHTAPDNPRPWVLREGATGRKIAKHVAIPSSYYIQLYKISLAFETLGAKIKMALLSSTASVIALLTAQVSRVA